MNSGQPAQSPFRHYSELEGEFSGEAARDHVAELVHHFRAPGSPGFHAAIDYVRSTLAQSGVEHEVHAFPLDGRTSLGATRVPLAWEPRGGQLEVVSPYAELLVRWDDCTSCIPWYCPPTPKDGVDLRLVDVGKGLSDSDFVGKDVMGSAVLVHDGGENFAWPDIVARAKAHGVAGIATNYLLYQFEPWRTRTSVPDAVQQLRLPAAHENPWVFSVAQPAFTRLQDLLTSTQGDVVLRFSVDAETFEGISRSVLATIPGSSLTDESIFLVAHVSAATKPGANCASGVALLLELARTIKKLIDDGRLDKPARNIHFLFANEDLGSLALVHASPTLLEGALAAISVCSVGNDQSRTRSSLVLGRSLDSLPTFLNDVAEGLIRALPRELGWAYRGGSREIPRLNWKVLPYTPWSDNVTWSKLGVPALLCMSLPDRFFHTQLLTLDELDPETFASSGLVLGTSTVIAAVAEADDAVQIARLIGVNAEARMNAVALGIEGDLTLADVTASNARSRLAYLVERDIASARSVLRLVEHASDDDQAAVADAVSGTEARLRERAALLDSELTADPADVSGAASADDGAARVVPRRTGMIAPHGIPGLTYQQVVELVDAMHVHDTSVVPETLQLLVDETWSLSGNGELTIDAITAALGHEFGFHLNHEHILQLARGMERAGYLELSGAE